MYKQAHKMIVVSSIQTLLKSKIQREKKKTEIVISFSGLGKVKVTQIPKKRDEKYGVG